MGRTLLGSLCALAVTFCVVPEAAGEKPRIEQRVAASAAASGKDPCIEHDARARHSDARAIHTAGPVRVSHADHTAESGQPHVPDPRPATEPDGEPAAGGSGEPGAAPPRRADPKGQRRDPHDLTPRQVGDMLADLRTTLDGLLGGRGTGQPRRAARAGRITVPVWFHVITDGRYGRVSEGVVRDQIRALNRTYRGARGGADTGVRFRLAGRDVTTSARWFRAPEAYEARMKRALRRGGAGTLNLYTAAVGSDVLGFSTFPQWYRDDPELDGVVVDYRTLPGGDFEHFNLGFTAVHEIGHWLGLFHTFENGCSAPGDGVDDTPYEATAATGCPGSRDTCLQPGRDPVRNYMNYVWDECMREFTRGQGDRVHASWAAYRNVTRAR